MRQDNQCMNLGVILPHTLLYGGVKRFLELGNLFIRSGHTFTVYTGDGIAPDWFDYKGNTSRFERLKEDPIDVLFCTEVKYLDLLVTSAAKRKIFYHIKITEKIQQALKYPDIEIFACSSNVYQYDKKKFGIEAFQAFGGVTIASYQVKDSYHVPTDRPFYIMAYGRLSRVKGTMSVVKACETLYKKGYNIKLLLFETPTNDKLQKRLDNFKASVPYEFILNHPFDKNSELFNRADLFVSAERHAGWCNTAAEAMACGVPVVATSAGTKDLIIDGETGLSTYKYSFFIWRKIRKFMEDEALRKRIGQQARVHVEQFDWEQLACRIETHLFGKG